MQSGGAGGSATSKLYFDIQSSSSSSYLLLLLRLLHSTLMNIPPCPPGGLCGVQRLPHGGHGSCPFLLPGCGLRAWYLRHSAAVLSILLSASSKSSPLCGRLAAFFLFMFVLSVLPSVRLWGPFVYFLGPLWLHLVHRSAPTWSIWDRFDDLGGSMGYPGVPSGHLWNPLVVSSSPLGVTVGVSEGIDLGIHHCGCLGRRFT